MNAPPPALIRALMDPLLYDHPVSGFTIAETHASWVLLTGTFAYKIKKPVDLGFLDFSTLALRRHFCEEELRLNRRLAPSLYRDVVAITGSADAPAINGAGPAIEYAVRMREFDPSQQLDRLIADGRLDAGCLSQLAADLADFHAHAARAGAGTRWGDPDAILQPVIENFDQIIALDPSPEDIALLRQLRAWSLDEHEALTPRFEQRRRDGHVRECHGDLHLGNIARVDGRAIPFDCLEFSPALRWTDVICEIAFLLMDLEVHRRADLALGCLDDWLQATGDWSGLDCLRYYLVYRAMVRAKVAAIQAGQHEDGAGREALLASMRTHLALAEDFTRERRPMLMITHGLSGSGKTMQSDGLRIPCRALRVRSDVERKRLHGLAPDARSGSAPGGGLYDPDSSRRTYQRLAECAAAIVSAGYSAIVDATFLEQAQRERFHALARELGVPFVILDYIAPVEVLRARISSRAAESRDASEAGLEVLALQLRNQEPLTAEEAVHALSIDTADPPDPTTLAARIAARARRPMI